MRLPISGWSIRRPRWSTWPTSSGPHRRSPRRRYAASLARRAGRSAGGAGEDQSAAPSNHRRADRAVGRQGQRGRGQGRRAAAVDAAGDGPAGRGRARKRAKIIHAEGEFQASQQLAEAAEIINRTRSRSSSATCRRLTEIGAEKNTTVVFPLPIDMVSAFVAPGSDQTGKSPDPSLHVAPPSTAEVAPPPPVDEDEL